MERIARRIVDKKPVVHADKVSVQDNVKRLLGEDGLPGPSVTWYQLNRIVEDMWAEGNGLEYVGEYLNKSGKLCAVFREVFWNRNGMSRKGELYFVDNDVVFNFQATGKPVERSGGINEKD